MEKRNQRSVRKAFVAVFAVGCILVLVQRYAEKKQTFFPEKEAVDGLPEPDRIVINAGPDDRDFSDWEEGAREAVYEKGSEGYRELYELTEARWKKAYRKGELSDEPELATYAHFWSSERGMQTGEKPVGLLMFFEYDDPIFWNKNGMETAEALVFRPEYQEGTAKDYQGEFSVQRGGRFLDAGSAYVYFYTEELVKAAERLAP